MRRPSPKRLVLLVLAVVCVFLLGATAIIWDGLTDELGHSDVALVLGNKIELDGIPSPRLRARLDRTIELYCAGFFPVVIASGGFGKEGFDEAVVMKAYLVSGGIPADRVVVDGQGSNTFASAQFAARFVAERRLKNVMVITQYFHVPRSKLALRRFGVSVVYSAHPSFFESRDPFSVAREVVGYVSYWLRSYPNVHDN